MKVRASVKRICDKCKIVRRRGVVQETLPHAMYRVRLEQGSLVMAHIADRIDRNFVRILVGDKVRIALSPTDAGRGRIIEKIG